MLPRLRRPELVQAHQMATWPEQGRERHLGSGSSATECALAGRSLSCRRKGLLTRRASLVPTSGHSNRESVIRASTPCPASPPRSISTPPTWCAGSRRYRDDDDACRMAGVAIPWRRARFHVLRMDGKQLCELVLYELVFAQVTLSRGPWPAGSLSGPHPTGRVWASRGRAAAKGSR